MPLDTQHIGHRFAPYSVDVEKGRLKFFAKAIGQTDPVYSDEAAARAAGHPALPVPKVLHGEQRFSYHAMAFAGDTLTFEQRIADIYAKKGGLLEFVVRETRVTNQHGQHIADLNGITVVRHG